MATTPIKRGPGRPRKEDDKPLGPDDRLKDVTGEKAGDDEHVLLPAPEDPNQDAPLPATAKATPFEFQAPGELGKKAEAERKKIEDENERLQKRRERAAKAFAVKDAPIAQAVFDAQDDPKEMKTIPVKLAADYWPLDGSDMVPAGSLYEMTRAELRAAKELGVADVDMDEI
jgi:hypothetical protein